MINGSKNNDKYSVLKTNAHSNTRPNNAQKLNFQINRFFYLKKITFFQLRSQNFCNVEKMLYLRRSAENIETEQTFNGALIRFYNCGKCDCYRKTWLSQNLCFNHRNFFLKHFYILIRNR